jgi:4-hydroxybenzoate polyprenyltransferase
MDGTLLATDVLWESLLVLLKSQPLKIFSLALWLFKGKAYFKRELARCVKLNPAALPYRESVLAYLREEKEAGRELVLATASDQRVAQSVADHLGIFSAVHASDGRVNLSGAHKRRALEKHYGSKGFAYIGNSEADLPIWQAADQALLVQPSSRLLKKARQASPVHRVFFGRKKRLPVFLKALRVSQWVKNILVFVPLLMAHKVTDVALAQQAVVAFFVFSLCASSVYIVNDLLDLESDRQHPRKKNRPFAAGALEIKTGVLLAPLLLVSSFVLSFNFLPPLFTVLLTLYLVLTTAYSFYLKRLLMIDVLILAGLYTLRVLAGGIAVAVFISPWLLAFSSFFFLNLAVVKRYAELRMMQERQQSRSSGRGYMVGDNELLRSIGPTAGYLSVLVLMLYINSREVTVLYHHPFWLWQLAPLLLYWITRIWFMAHRGQMDDDPIVFAVKDPISYAVGAGVAAILVLASL